MKHTSFLFCLPLVFAAMIALPHCSSDKTDDTTTALLQLLNTGSPPAISSGAYTVGGTVLGLRSFFSATQSVTLRDDISGEEITVESNGDFRFFGTYRPRTGYLVTVTGATNQAVCAVANGTGNIAATDVSNVQVTCSTDIKYMVVGEFRKVYVSSNLTDWNHYNISGAGNINDVIYANGNFVAAGDAGKVYYSTDGLDWTVTNAGNRKLNGIAHDGVSRFVVVDGNNQSYYSVDGGKNWMGPTIVRGFGTGLLDVAHGNGLFFAVGPVPNNERLMHTASDGTSWGPSLTVNVSGGTTFNGNAGVAHGGGIYVNVGNDAIGYSLNGSSWSPATSYSSTTLLRDVDYGNGRFVAVGGNSAPYEIRYSSDGDNWSNGSVTGTGTGSIMAVAHVGGTNWLATGTDLWKSTDNGNSWTLILNIAGGTTSGIAYKP